MVAERRSLNNRPTVVELRTGEKNCGVFGLDQDQDGRYFPDTYTGFLYCFPDPDKHQPARYLFFCQHEPDEVLTRDEMLEAIFEQTGRVFLEEPAVVSVKIEPKESPRQGYRIINKKTLSDIDLFVVDKLLEAQGLKRSMSREQEDINLIYSKY